MSEFDKSVYDEHYYQTSFGGIPYNRAEKDGHWVKFFSSIAKEIKVKYNPKRVMDVGCAKGFLVESLRDQGIYAYGFDISDVAIREVRDDIKPFCKLGSVDDAEMYQGQYDLITCIEIMEHVPENMAEVAIKLMCEHSNVILFSSSPDDFEEPTHINVRPAEYWDEFFVKYGFSRAHETWPSQSIAPQTVIYRKVELEQVEKLSGELAVEISKSSTVIENVINNKTDNVERLLNEVTSINDEQFHALSQNLMAIQHQIKEMSDVNFQNERLHHELEKLQSDTGNYVKEISHMNEQIGSLANERDSSLNQIHVLNDSVSQQKNQLDMIKSGTAFRLLSKYWNTRDRILPAGSKRRKLVKSILGKKDSLSEMRHVNSPIEANNDFWSMGFNKWVEDTTLDQHEISRQISYMNNFIHKPLISIALPVYIIPVEIFKETIESVIQQTYTNWELCIAFGDSSGEEIISYVRTISEKDKRVKYVVMEKNGGISMNTNACMELSTGEFVGLLDHDDLLTQDALFRMVEYINKDPYSDFLYSDKDQITGDGINRLNPLFKHGWSWPTMLSANYPTHFCVIRSELLNRIGLFDKETDGAQDWDIFLKVSEVARKIVHVPYVLYHWRIIETSVASGLQAKPYVTEAQIKTLNNYIKRNNINAELLRKDSDHTFRLVYKGTENLQYNVLIYGDSDSTLQKFTSTLKSISQQKKSPNVIFTLSELNLKDVFSNYQINYNQFSKISEIVDTLKNDSSDLLIIKAGIIVDSKDASFDMSNWLKQSEYTSVSGVVKKQNGCIENAGYVISHEHQVIQPYQGMYVDAYTTYGSAAWYRQYLSVSELAVMVKSNDLYEYLNSNLLNISRTEDIIFNFQISENIRTGKSSLYNPYIEFTTSSDNYETNLMTKEKIQDTYFNSAVWDWNPEYQKQTLGRKTSYNHVAQDNSIWSGYTNDAIILSSLYDFTVEDVDNNRRIIESNKMDFEEATSAIWFLPPFSSAFYGGIHTILRFAEYLNVHKNIKSKFVIVGSKDISDIKKSLVEAFPLLSKSEVIGLVNDKEINSLPQSDLSFCTLWTTAYTQLKYNKTNFKFYFLQDWEPLFYPGGTTSAQVEVTYDFGFTAVCNTVSLKESYEELGGKAVHFTPSVDTSVFYPIDGLRKEDQFLVFLYGRPGNPRNCFELAIPAMRKVKDHFGDRVRIVSAGADWNPAAYNAEGVIEHLGMLPYKKTADLYRRCHVGVAMMMTRHPSYLPFELMACGSLVVANENRWNKWLLKHNENCILSKPSVSCLSKDIIDALDNKIFREKLAKSGCENVLSYHSDWDREFNELYKKVIEKTKLNNISSS